MDLIYVIQLIRAVLKELWRHKYQALATGITASFIVLAAGMAWQEQYEVNTTLYADRQNIISPLLAGQAQVTRVENRRQLVTDLITSPRILEKVVTEAGFLKGGEGAAEQAAIVSGLGKRIDVRMLGENYISIAFADALPERAFKVVTMLVDYFISESSASKKSQSKQAFLFIDRQADAYKEQLREAEDKLKQFKANNLDGTEARVNMQIENLRENISNLKLDLEQVNARMSSLATQVAQENRYLSNKAQSDLYQERIEEALSQLDNLRLSLTDNHPDVINLKQHIEGLRASAASGEQVRGVSGSGAGIENPLYDTLRGQLAEAKVEKSTMQKKLSALNLRLEEEYDRAKRVAERNAELSELVRDYDVTKSLYEDLLNRKEQARLSMTLDIEGQGVTYKIQEPAQFPLSPSGLSFRSFVILGAFIGITLPLGLAFAYVVLDPRLRFSALLDDADYSISVMAVVPHFVSISEQRVRRRQLQWCLFIGIVAVLIYLSLAVFYSLWN